MKGLFSVSPTLQASIEQARERVCDAFQDEVRLVEYITLPEAGQHVVLRFALQREISTLDEVDTIENALDQLVGEEFWVVLVGETYGQVEPELPLAALPVHLGKFARVVSDIPVPAASTPYAPQIKKDGQIIRACIPLGPNDWVWEVEVPLSADKTQPIIRIVSERTRDKQMITIGEQDYSVEYVPQSESYVGLVKAYPLARQAGRSLVRYIFERTGGGVC